MGSPTSSFLGYGYAVDLYSDSPYDYNNQSELFEEWKTQVTESTYCHFLSSYDEEYCFFGVRLSDYIDAGEIIDLETENNLSVEWREWGECNAEFHKFFPNLKQNPHLKLLNIYWG